MYYVVVDIGCMECGENSAVIGIFKDKEIAEQNRFKCEEEHSKHWHGEHSFEIFEINKMNEAQHIEYRR